ncbi:hypothetical protein E2C01_063551 [Portunus trituberculatus]|uniref:Uncharacterized protein n=1 Tax=Portunus trituberculatus TaxID=210409 RepID=A0A5B7HHX5_PORTR|nr:hypothetical protein [Portunus trituberculatus]
MSDGRDGLNRALSPHFTPLQSTGSSRSLLASSSSRLALPAPASGRLGSKGRLRSARLLPFRCCFVNWPLILL